ncbi:MAG: dihydropteroate synthase [Candidatus Dormibacteria bacterium]
MERTVIAGDHRLHLGSRTLVMGVVNATPDSFSGDGLDNPAAAADRALGMVAAGADSIDVGGESTRPHSQPIPVEEELARVLPVIRAVRARVSVPLSIDSRHAAVADAGVAAGASMVNDIWGLRADPEMAEVVARRGVAVVAMHNQRHAFYADLITDVGAGLEESLAIARSAGVPSDRIILDPGFGFGKTPAHNVELIRRLAELTSLGFPLLVGASRKSTIGALLDGAPVDTRLEGGLALAILACAAGADIVRVHDVAETVRALRVADAVVRATPAHISRLGTPGPTG